MADVFRIVTAEGHEYDFHGGVEQLKEMYPGATITGRRIVSEVGEGTYEPYTLAKAQAAERRAAEDEKPKRKTKRDEDAPRDDGRDEVVDETPETFPSVETIVVEAPAA